MKLDKMSGKSRTITSDPKILNGTPVILGTRIPVSRILFLLKDGHTVESIAEEYPHVGKNKIEKVVNEVINSYKKPLNVTQAL